jgi:hypothetical protein
MTDQSRRVPDTAEQRAAELVDQAGQTLNAFAALAFRRILTAGARAHEEVADFWAQAGAVPAARARGGR